MKYNQGDIILLPYPYTDLSNTNQRPAVIFTTLNEWGDRSRSHGLSPAILEAQAKAIGCPSVTISTSWENYTEKYIARLNGLNYCHGNIRMD